jgi:uncharacterized membrane protein
MSSPTNTAQKGCGPFAVLRRARNVKNAKDAERNALLDDAERIEAWCAWLVLGAIVLEVVVWIAPLCPFLFKFGNAVSDGAVAIGIYGEMRFGHVVADILKILLAEAIERAANAERQTEKLRAATDWRSLSQTEHDALSLALRADGARASVKFSVVMNDQESLHFAQLISISFKAAGWNVGYSFESYNHEILTGTLLPEPSVSWPDEMHVVNRRVREAFIAADLRFATGWLSAYMSTGAGEPLIAPIAHIYVGPKPMPMLE